MASLVKKLSDANLINCPSFLPDNTHYETMMGSVAYGVSDTESDVDVYGWCIPPKEILFPQYAGVIIGFDREYRRFENWQQHHISFDKKKEYDVTIFNIVHFFRLCADGNPNMVDSLFTPSRCILHMSRIAEIVREKKKIFLSKKCYHTTKGYSFAQMSKIKSGVNSSSEKRKVYYDKYGYDVKFAYHVVRLLLEGEEILLEGDLTLDRNADLLKAIRNGEWKLDDICNFFDNKVKQLETAYHESNAVPFQIREEEIKDLLLHCLEEHYGNLEKLVSNPNREKMIIEQIRELIK